MANWTSLANMAAGLINSLSDTDVTISREVNSYDRRDAVAASWTGKGVFNWERSIVRDGTFLKATTITVPISDAYTPQLGDTVTANGKTWVVKSLIEGGVGQPLYYELELGR